MMGNRRIILLFPVIGITLFVILYLLAAWYYPGGSQADQSSVGFSWTDNYWCNLLDKNAINGFKNISRPFALSGMVVLLISLSVFFYIVPHYSDIKAGLKRMIGFSGIASMITVLFLELGSHDLILNIAGVFGFIAFGGIVSIMIERKWYGLALTGFINLFLVAINNLLYYNPGWIHFLPSVQKITFVCFLIWISLICLKVYRLSIPDKNSNQLSAK
ncbi:MAG TPA: hypothetical protein VFX73_04905 [Chitinophagaceae bacterium]|nr:hypothetical protein [Chitinophagaceae bacterium]